MRPPHVSSNPLGGGRCGALCEASASCWEGGPPTRWQPYGDGFPGVNPSYPSFGTLGITFRGQFGGRIPSARYLCPALWDNPSDVARTPHWSPDAAVLSRI